MVEAEWSGEMMKGEPENVHQHRDGRGRPTSAVSEVQ